MNKNIVFYLPKGSLNDATNYYVSLIEESFVELGCSVTRVENVTGVKGADVALTIETVPFFSVKRKFPLMKQMNWFQGVFPEEAYLNRKSIFYYYIFNCLEMLSLNFSKLNFMVSDAMLKHYENKYKLKLANKSVIIPCYNKLLIKKYFNILGRYDKPSFVYAGSLSKWQCIEETLQIYSQIEKELPNATLTLLTKEKEKALGLIKKYNIKNCTINYVLLDNLDKELSKYKYGFLIRKDDVINNVATPTKMNSYLATGLIPIFTDVIYDFNKHINMEDYVIKLDNKKEIELWVRKIIDFENNTKINSNDYFIEVEKCFNNYYSDLLYKNKIKNKIKEILT
ncbi:hypothetical protein [Tenacibaculum finnmarkense]|uniref:hypothetical protein n=1 Tax=Tenacibaculum finnmarkense TaxID=2781243 RepID=UPI001EFB5393|nr:hypothetical protein [Tenacibaculum finnmarkense]MCG8236932.1 hypothetical protein [Tenacibaculum finnmarkense genomovar ulcerans]MCG8749732.1 glycosyltransferase family 4 protein [Tenacibaculum finnmarkense]MCG8754849.1 glycosyltransferase family 4 protein [Tenacibaculum finnmarkense]MCG8783767.1 glycosyltransferase family 4 protein [Tenacibaculum finnmarkense]MCG8831036.1 glycosyltransferase family 4 protein [Tenacibaculum finnmarkense]